MVCYTLCYKKCYKKKRRIAGLGNSAADYTALATTLTERGLAVETASVNRLDWARNAAGLADVNWWRGTLSPRPTVDWCVTSPQGMPYHCRSAELIASTRDSSSKLPALTLLLCKASKPQVQLPPMNASHCIIRRH